MFIPVLGLVLSVFDKGQTGVFVSDSYVSDLVLVVGRRDLLVFVVAAPTSEERQTREVFLVVDRTRMVQPYLDLDYLRYVMGVGCEFVRCVFVNE